MHHSTGRSAILAVALLLVITLNHVDMAVVVSDGNVESYILYFINGIVVYDSQIDETLILETPTNISLKEGFEQKVVHLIQYNLFFNETIGAYTFNATRDYVGFFLSRVEVYSKPMQQMYRSVVEGLLTPMSTSTSSSIEVPLEVSNYLRSPHLKVVNVVKPEYERWFLETYGYDVKHLRPLGIATTAAYFIQRIFINYDPSGIPRTIDEVIDARLGDCDDMSRILVELLNAYNISAVICVGYVHVNNFNITMPIENVTYKYVNCGPHAFVMAYIPDYGWLSLDFLALTFLVRPFVFESYSRETVIKEEAIQESLRLHRSLNATQVMVLLSEEEVLELLGGSLTLEAVMRYFRSIIGMENEAPLETFNESDAKKISKKEVEDVRVGASEIEYVVGTVIVILALMAFITIVLIRRVAIKNNTLNLIIECRTST